MPVTFVFYHIGEPALTVVEQGMDEEATMYEIDPQRTDLVEEFWRNPSGPYSPELNLLVNRLRLLPMGERFILVTARNGGEWTVARLPNERGRAVELLEDRVFDDYNDACREVFRLRWQAITGLDPREDDR